MNFDNILIKLEKADFNLSILSLAEKKVLTDALDNFCKEVGIETEDVNGGIDIHLN